MNIAAVDEARLKDVVKTAVLEVFEERRDWLADLLSEALLDMGLGYAIQEGEQTLTVSREERELRSQLQSAAEVVFAKLWDNEGDEVWNEYL